jgi:2-polyprenyl-6-methoxyphenol hydroxylase-like FAD-dependent oxidoreductase
MACFDVLIAGGGPAGCATAISLADFAPSLQVGLIDPAEHGKLRIGETVPPHIKPTLVHLGLWKQFDRDGHCSSYRTMASWGNERLGSNEFLLHTHQIGWRLDRATFDRMLLEAALSRVCGRFTARVVAMTSGADGWRLSLSDGTEHRARFVVDATGNVAALARQCQLSMANFDRLVACCLYTGSRSDGTEGLMIETFSDGWWYTAAIPGGPRIVVCMTDADLVRALKLSLTGNFLDLLAKTNHVRRTAEVDRTLDQPTIVPASSRFFSANPALSLLCVGDSGSRYDPVCGQGIIKALRSGTFASYAIADWLHHADDRGLVRYRLMLQREFAAYRITLQDYYAQEQRWSQNPFWRRRHSGPTSV